MVAQIVATNQISVTYNLISCVVGSMGVFVMLCQCSVTVTMFCNNVL